MTSPAATLTDLEAMAFNETSNIHYSRPATIFAAVAASIFTFVGITGNLLTVVALLKCQKLRSHATTMFVISLAVSDLLFCTINLPLTASRYVHEKWILGQDMCRLFPFFFYGNVAASLMNMVAITINRYILIACHANYSRIYSHMNIFLMIAFVWLFSFGMMVPPLLEVWGTLGLDEQTFSCTILKRNDTSPKKFLMIFGFLMPCIVIIACYSAIFLKVRQSRKNVQSHMKNNRTTAAASNGTAAAGTAVPANKNGESSGKNAISAALNSAQSAQRREDIRLTKMMLIIFLSFLVCFLPLMVVNVADDGVQIPFLHILASVLAWASAVVNPFIYAFKNRQYQQAFIKVRQQILCCREPSTSAPPRGGNKSAESRTSASKTFLTDMLHFSSATDKIRMMRQNGQSSQTNGGRNHSNAEFSSNGGGLHNHGIPLASNSTHFTNSTNLTVPSFTTNSVNSPSAPTAHQQNFQQFQQNNSGIQIKDSEIV